MQRQSFLVVLLVVLTGHTTTGLACADTLETIQKRGTLIWGADIQGGAPFIIPDPNNPREKRGVEVDLMEKVALELGVKLQYQQCQWDQIPLMLEQGNIDFALNALELNPNYVQRFIPTRPYYAFGFQLTVPRGGNIQRWVDLENPTAGRRPTVGVLVSSAAARFLQKNYADSIELREYDNDTDAMQHVNDGVLDAAVHDDSVANFYADRYPKLQLAERPTGTEFYVGLCRKEDQRLADAINQALERLIAKGDLERILDNWDMGGRFQSQFLQATNPTVLAEEKNRWQVVENTLGILLQAAGVTVFLTLTAFPLAIGIGLLVALGRLYGPRWLSWLLTLYVEVLRGTPLMLQLYVIFFLLLPTIREALVSGLGWELPAWVAALVSGIIGLAINYSACEAENYRAGLQAIPAGQMEAALSLGMSQWQALRRILIPQAIRIVIPPVTNDFIAMFKDTSVCSAITVVELTKQYNVLAQSTGEIVLLATITATLYLMMSYPLSLLARYSEKRLRRGSRSEG